MSRKAHIIAMPTRRVHRASLDEDRVFERAPRRSSELRSKQHESAKKTSSRATITDFKRARTKAKADRKFARTYGAASMQSGSQDAGPRPALYKGEMGAHHKRAARMQQSASKNSSKFAMKNGRSTHAKKKSSKKVYGLLTVAVCVAITMLFLYAPAQQYYHEVRHLDQLQAEYEAIQSRNELLQASVDALQTDEGIEDRARQEFGWVRDGENSVAVAGLDVPTNSSFRANVIAGSVEAPQTWYSVLLDPIFGSE